MTPPTPILLSWSSGKDSAWALHVLRGDPRFEVRGLFTTSNGPAERVAMHGVRNELLAAQARSVGLPLVRVDLPFPCSNEDYERVMTEALEPLVTKGIAGAEAAGPIRGFAFGDLFLEDVRAYRERQLEPLGLAAHFPLWGRDTRELAHEMIAAGTRAHLTSVDPRQCPRELAGRPWDEALLAELPDGVDPCGENGEFHTFVSAGPALATPLPSSRARSSSAAASSSPTSCPAEPGPTPGGPESAATREAPGPRRGGCVAVSVP